MKPTTLPLSVVIITLNEELNIRRALQSVSWADEVLIYDSGSKDQTVQIAREMGAKVIEGPWLGFGPTKHKATQLANNDWILSLDADEEVSDELKNELINNFSDYKSDILYRIPRLSYYLDRWIRHGGWFPDRQNRLFNKNFYQWNFNVIHEKVELIKPNAEVQNPGLAQEFALQSKSLQSKSLILQNPLHHYVFKNIEHQVETNNRYSTLQAKAMFEQGKKYSTFHYLTKPTVKFIECFFIKLGFLDGDVGYLIARNAAYSVFLKWAKLKQLHISQHKSLANDNSQNENSLNNISKNNISKNIYSNILFLVIFWALFLMVNGLNFKAQAYPVIESWLHQPQILLETQKKMDLQKNKEINLDFFVSTSQQEELTLKFTGPEVPSTQLTVYANSQLQLEKISENKFSDFRINLMKGHIRFDSTTLEASTKNRNESLLINTVFFSLKSPKNADFIIELDMTVPKVNIKMIQGEWAIQFFEYEKRLTLKAGQQVEFVGIKSVHEGDQIQYDYLMDQKKVPKGQIKPILKFNQQHYIIQKKSEKDKILKSDQQKKDLINKKIKQKKLVEESYLCKKPFAHLNQCVWRIDKNQCFRLRCNVDGQWGDSTERPITSTLCQKTKDASEDSVAECDY